MATDTGSLIDPVSGLPYNVLNPTIDQFPYGGMPVAWDDLQIKGPRRTLYYPDDVPPVVATLEAINSKDTDNAQALHSDGANRLLVSSDTPIPVDIQSGTMHVDVTCNCTGGGGGFPGPRLSARIGLLNDWVPSGGFLANHTQYVAWDTAQSGSAAYLDVAHTDGVTIPARWDGAYLIAALLYNSNFDSDANTDAWSIEWTITCDQYRAGAWVDGVSYVDLLQQPDHGGGAGSGQELDTWSIIPMYLPGAALCDCRAGDVIKLGVAFQISGAMTLANSYIDHTQSWLSIVPIP